MSPEEILLALNDADGELPSAALRAAGERRAEIVPLLVEAIERAATAPVDELDEAPQVFFGALLLGEWRETSAYRPLARLLRRADDGGERIFGDAGMEAINRVMANVFDGDPEPLYEVVFEPGADPFIRWSMFDALAILAVRGAFARERVARFLAEAFEKLAPDDDGCVWAGWVDTVQTLGLAELTPLVKRAFDEGRVDESMMDFSDFEKGLARAAAHPDAPFPAYSHNAEPWEDTIAELSTWHCYTEEGRRERERWKERRDRGEELPSLWDDAPSFPAPYVNAFKDVGRNDPCPCGSGKKYKKCCLGR